MTLKGDAKFKGKLTLDLKNDIRNLINFRACSCKTENLHFYGLALSKAYNVLGEKVQKSDPKKSSFWRNMHFLCDARDLKQSV